ncbi:MAG: hypothetical protein OXI67_06485 [Candidatus Poribacteria bacterium]|nr:hypothetical protein [Candidatus Poribacteria bacterium]
MKNKYRILSFIAVYLITFYIAGCGSDDSDEPTNNSPTVDTFLVPTEFNPGETLEFKVIAFDEDGDPLDYTWTVSAGKLSSTTGTTVKWTAPPDIESVTVTVIVSDGVSKSTKRVKKSANKKFIPPDPIEEILPDPDPPQINLIVPGRSAAGIRLGDPFKNVEKVHGKPDGPLGVARRFSYQDRGLSGYIDGIGLVEHIFVRRPNKAKTAGRRGIGNTLKQVEEEFGNAEREDPLKDGVKTHWYWKRGISFNFDVDDKVTMIFIFKPHAAAPGAEGAPLQQQQEMRKAAIEALHYKETLTTQSED